MNILDLVTNCIEEKKIVCIYVCNIIFSFKLILACLTIVDNNCKHTTYLAHLMFLII